MKHTPGPWIAEMVENGEGTLVYGRIKEKGNRHSLAFAGVYEGHNAEANARLIAAAPKLLETLKDVMGWIDNWKPDFADDDAWPFTSEKARIIIEKASS